MKKLLLLGLGGALLYSGMKKKQLLDNLEYEFGSFKVHGWNIANPLSIETRLTLNILNPSNEAQRIQSTFLKIFYKGQLAGYVDQKKEQVIQAQSATPLTFPVVLNLKNLVTEIPAIIKSKGALEAVTLEGFLTASGVNIPVKNTIKLGL